MISFKIDNKVILVPKGTTVLEAARSAGIDIPTLCYLNGQTNHPSCMVCQVMNRKTGALTNSCSLTATDGMDLLSDDPLVYEARRTAIELLLSDHSGDCEAPCNIACPVGMNIPLMNRHIASGKLKEAMDIISDDMALPHILGYVCPAPCEKACRRKQIDAPVPVCLLKRFVASSEKHENKSVISSDINLIKKNKKIAVIGSGPAGLSVSYYLLKMGYSCVIFDKNPEAGGELRSIPESELPHEVIDSEIEKLKLLGADLRSGTLITKDLFESELQNKFDSIVIATGDISKTNYLNTLFQCTGVGIAAREGSFSTSLPGIFACGSVINPHKLTVRSVMQGKTVAMAVDCYLHGFYYSKKPKRFNSRFEKLFPAEFNEYLKESAECAEESAKHDHLCSLTYNEAVKEAGKCMHCDCRKVESCRLRDCADKYMADRKKYLIGERKTITKNTSHPELVYEPAKCIKCGLCVDITLKYNEKTGMAFTGRGFDVVINASLGMPLSDGLTKTARKCAMACPTGALSVKNEL